MLVKVLALLPAAAMATSCWTLDEIIAFNTYQGNNFLGAIPVDITEAACEKFRTTCAAGNFEDTVFLGCQKAFPCQGVCCASGAADNACSNHCTKTYIGNNAYSYDTETKFAVLYTDNAPSCSNSANTGLLNMMMMGQGPELKCEDADLEDMSLTLDCKLDAPKADALAVVNDLVDARDMYSDRFNKKAIRKTLRKLFELKNLEAEIEAMASDMVARFDFLDFTEISHNHVQASVKGMCYRKPVFRDNIDCETGTLKNVDQDGEIQDIGTHMTAYRQFSSGLDAVIDAFRGLNRNAAKLRGFRSNARFFASKSAERVMIDFDDAIIDNPDKFGRAANPPAWSQAKQSWDSNDCENKCITVDADGIETFEPTSGTCVSAGCPWPINEFLQVILCKKCVGLA